MKPGVGIVLCLAFATMGVAGEGPLPVSPGGQIGISAVAGRCPTFHWTATAGTKAIDLVVYRVPDEGEKGPAEKVLSVTLPGAAHGWTPALGQCLVPGVRYAWAVGESGEWSEASLFEISPLPSISEVEEAMGVLRRYMETKEHPVQDQEGPARSRANQVRSRAGQPRLKSPALLSPSVGPLTSSPMVPPPASYALSIDGDISLGGSVFKDNYSFLHNDGGNLAGNTALGLGALDSTTPDLLLALGIGNTALGDRALGANTSGARNTATGTQALVANTDGFANTAMGASALRANLGGYRNTALGANALRSNTTGVSNTASGMQALFLTTIGSHNTATGHDALFFNLTGSHNTAAGVFALYRTDTSYNTAFGSEALRENTAGSHKTAIGWRALRASTGSRNIALGSQAGGNLTSGDDNIHIGNAGLATENTSIRIGSGVHTQTFLAGVSGRIAGGSDPVLIGGNAKLGTIAASSRRYKEDIRELGDLTEKVSALRVVRFRYTKEILGSAEPRPELGLIAEEVAEVLPELVIYDDEGKPLSVRYHLLSPILLNELQKQHRQNRMQWGLLGLMLVAGVSVTVGRWPVVHRRDSVELPPRR